MEQLDINRCKIVTNRNYKLPKIAYDKVLYIISSYSENTEEVLSCLKEVQRKKNDYFWRQVTRYCKKTKIPYKKRIKIFMEIMEKKNLDTYIITPIGKTLLKNYFLAIFY